MNTTQHIISIENVSKTFGPYTALKDINLSIDDGEIVTLLGPSGCGKTTLMRLIAGFDSVSGGKLVIGGEDSSGVPPERRPVNMVFQRYALFPHLDVYENIAYGLRVKRLHAGEIDKRVKRMLSIVQLEALSHRYIHELSGGQCQRVALARALVNEPKVLLLDEPLAALDLKIRQHMLIEMRRIHAQTGATFVYVTHDQDEALILSDRIVLMERGRIAQIDEPHKMYENPKSLFAAKFLGETNLFDATVAGDGTARTLGGVEFRARYNYSSSSDDKIVVSIRPECFRFEPSEKHNRSMPGTVIDEVFIGSRSILSVRTRDDNIVKVQVQRGSHAPLVDPSKSVELHWSDADVSIFPAS